MHTLLVPAATIFPGEPIGGSMLKEKPFYISSVAVSNWVTVPDEIEGKHAKRALPAGKPIPISSLKVPEAVKRGVPARALYRGNGLEISTTLIPTRDAMAGEWVEARNAETGTLVSALVQANGQLLLEEQ